MSGEDAPKAGGGAGDASAALSLLERRGGKRAGQVATAVAVGRLLWPAAKWLWDRRESTEDFTITVAGTDEAYPDLHEWVLGKMPEAERRAMIAQTEVVLEDDEDSDGGAGFREVKKLKLRYDGSRRQQVRVDGHVVVVSVERENVPERASLPENWRQYMEKITFTARDAAGRDAVVEMIDGLLESKRAKDPEPTLFMPSRWGGEWVRRGDAPARELDSVVLKSGQLERLVDDLDGFLKAEREYMRLGQPWHRGYLLHGPPGTGKTSVAKALAAKFGLDTYYLPLGDIEKDSNLTQYVAAIKPRSVLLLEDVDVFHAATERDERDDKASIAGMLNSLDGVWTPHGMITIMTTNCREALDPALVRAGRVDVEEELDELDAEQAEAMAGSLGIEIDASEYVGRAPSDLVEAAKGELLA